MTETGIHSKKLSVLVICNRFIQKTILGHLSFSCRFFPPRIRVIRRTNDQLIYLSILKFPRGAYQALDSLHSLQLRGHLGPRKHRTCRKTTALRARPLPCAQNHCPERSKELLETPLGAPGRSKWLLEPWLSAPRRSKWVFEPPLGNPRALKVVV